MLENYVYIIRNDEDLRMGIKRWFSNCQNLSSNEIIFFVFDIIHNQKVERFSANGFNNLLIVICALKSRWPNIHICVQLIPDQVIEMLESEKGNETIKKGIRNLLIFFESLNLIEMLLKLGVIVRPSDESIKKLVLKLDAKKEERKYIYSSKILCLNPLINNEQEQYNLTYRMKTLLNILYWQMKDNIDFKEVEEASGQIMFELVKNIYQHAGISNDLKINGFTCAQINSSPIIQFCNESREKKYTESVFLALSQQKQKFRLDNKNKGSFISITVNDFGIGIHKKVRERNQSLSTKDAIIYAFTTNFSSKISESEQEYWRIGAEKSGVKLEHKGFGLLYCLLFVFKNLGRIKICAGNIEISLFSKIDFWANNYQKCNTPVDFLSLLTSNGIDYTAIFESEVKELDQNEFVGTQILIEIPADNIYCRG